MIEAIGNKSNLRAVDCEFCVCAHVCVDVCVKLQTVSYQNNLSEYINYLPKLFFVNMQCNNNSKSTQCSSNQFLEV